MGATGVAGVGIIEAALACERLTETERLDLACHLALCAVRGAWAAGAADPDETTRRSRLGRKVV